MEQEIWKPVPNFPGYEVSSLGNIRSYRNSWGRIIDVSHPRKPITAADGRLVIGFKKNRFWDKSNVLLHHMILSAFVGPRPEGMVACHNDDNCTNNRIENLRWDTKENNWKDEAKNDKFTVGEKNGQAILTKEQVIEIRNCYKKGKITHDSLAKKYGVNRITITNIITGVSWKSVGGKITPARKNRVGSNNTSAKLSPDNVAEIRSRVADGENRREIAKRYCLNKLHVDSIVARRCWKHI